MPKARVEVMESSVARRERLRGLRNWGDAAVKRAQMRMRAIPMARGRSGIRWGMEGIVVRGGRVC